MLNRLVSEMKINTQQINTFEDYIKMFFKSNQNSIDNIEYIRNQIGDRYIHVFEYYYSKNKTLTDTDVLHIRKSIEFAKKIANNLKYPEMIKDLIRTTDDLINAVTYNFSVPTINQIYLILGPDFIVNLLKKDSRFGFDYFLKERSRFWKLYSDEHEFQFIFSQSDLRDLIKSVDSLLFCYSKVSSYVKYRVVFLEKIGFDYITDLLCKENYPLLSFLEKTKSVNNFNLDNVKHTSRENLQILIYSLEDLIKIKSFVCEFDNVCFSLGEGYIKSLVLSNARPFSLTYFLSVLEDCSSFKKTFLNYILSSKALSEFVSNQAELLELLKILLIEKDKSVDYVKILLTKLGKDYFIKILKSDIIEIFLDIYNKIPQSNIILIFILNNNLFNEKNLIDIVNTFNSKTKEEWVNLITIVDKFNKLNIKGNQLMDLLLFRFQNHWNRLNYLSNKFNEIYQNSCEPYLTYYTTDKKDATKSFLETILKFPNFLKRIEDLLNGINICQAKDLIKDPKLFIENLVAYPQKLTFVHGFLPINKPKDSESSIYPFSQHKLFDINVVKEVVFKFL